jgi:hypothetical protein
MPDVVDLRAAPAGSPEWWLARLLARLEVRRFDLDTFEAYYDGHQPLAFASQKFRDAFGTRFREFSSNFMALVVDAPAERLEVQGFRFRDAEGDADIWRRIWQENDLDAGSQLAHVEALMKGVAYALIEPQPHDAVPLVTVEDACDTAVEVGPKDRRERVAALKRWLDDEGHLVAYVHLPDAVYKYRSLGKAPVITVTTPVAGELPVDSQGSGGVQWTRFEVLGEEWPLPNPLGVVPVVPLPNRPRLSGRSWSVAGVRVASDGRSEIAAVMSNQDAINKYRADALVASEFAAFRQRWAIGIDIPTDPETGNPIEPFKPAVDRLWTFPRPDPEDPNQSFPQVGEFAATELEPYKLMIETEVGHISSISRIPYHFFLGQPQAIPPSGESLKSSEAGLVRKVGRIALHLGEGWEEVMRLCLLAMGDARGRIRSAETIWRDPETQNEAVRTDAVLKQFQSGVIDLETAQEQLGYSPEQVRQMRERRAAEPAPTPTPAADTSTPIGAGFTHAVTSSGAIP